MRKTTIFIAIILGIVLFFQPVLANPGISVSIEVIDKITGDNDQSAEYNVKVESITFIDEDVILTIRPAEPSELQSGESAADISWFDWTTQSFSIAPGTTEEFPLYASLPAGVSEGIYRFVADGVATVPGMPFLPDEKSDSKEIIEVDMVIVPETSTLALTGIGLFGMCLLMYRRKK